MGAPIRNTRLLVTENRIIYPTIEISTNGYTFLDLNAKAKAKVKSKARTKSKAYESNFLFKGL